jgi:hypothetical protein
VQQELVKRGAPLGLLTESESLLKERLIKNYRAEIERRVKLVLAFFQISWPQNNTDWLRFVMKLCEHWDIPGFQLATAPERGPGADKKWTDKRNCELFADVSSLVRRGMSESAACAHIAKNPKKFNNRYGVKRKGARKGDDDSETLRRQYVRVKAQIQTDALFRLAYFGEPFGAVPKYDSDLIEEAIGRYAVAQES